MIREVSQNLLTKLAKLPFNSYERLTSTVGRWPWCSGYTCLLEKSEIAGSNPTGLQVSRKQNVSTPLTREHLILCGASVTERWRARPQTARARNSNPVSGRQYHLIHFTILRRFSWPSLAYMCTKVAKKPIHFISFLTSTVPTP